MYETRTQNEKHKVVVQERVVANSDFLLMQHLFMTLIIWIAWQTLVTS